MEFKYRGLRARLEHVDVTDEEVTRQLVRLQQQSQRRTPVFDRPSQNGDELVLDYAGFADGQQFAGGTAEKQTLVLGSGTFIPGFEEQLVGKNPGDDVTVHVTFPAQYHAPELAGKDATFHIKVHEITRRSTPTLDDAFAKEQFQVDTVDEMYDQIRSYMESSAEYNKQKDTTTAVQNYLIDNCEAEVPEDYLTARVDDYRRQYIEQNCNGDESQLADYVSTYYGKTVEEMEAYWNEGMEKSIRLEFIMDAIADELGVEVNQDDIDTYAEQLVSQNGYESVEAMYNIYGFGDTDYGKRYFADLYRYDQALDQLLETAVVTIDPSADTESDAVTEDAADATEAGSAADASTTYEAAEGTEKTGAAN